MAVSDSPDCMLRREIHTSFSALEAEWNPLLRSSRFNSFFLTYEWQTTWWSFLGHGDLWIVAFRDVATDALVAIIPLYHDRYSHPPKPHATSTEAEAGQNLGGELDTHPEELGDESRNDDAKPNGSVRRDLFQLTLVGCLEVSDYLDLIIAKGWEEQVYACFAEWLDSDDAPLWDRLDLCNLPEASQTYEVGASVFEARGWPVEVVQEDVAPQFALPLRYDDYLAQQVDKKQRHEIRRKQRKAVRETDVDFYIVGLDPDADKKRDIEAELDDFIRLQRASREDKAEFMTAEMEHFFKGMARYMLEAGYLRLAFLTLNNEKAATLFAFEYNDSFLLYNSGYEPEVYKQHSPGWVLTAYTVQYAIAAGLRLYDFMQGDEEYKYRFGAQDYKVMRVIVDK